MNGYSSEVKLWHHEHLLRKWRELSATAKYAGSSYDAHWLYRAVLEELDDRGIDPTKTMQTKYGAVIPCDKNGKPLRDDPNKYLRRTGW